MMQNMMFMYAELLRTIPYYKFVKVFDSDGSKLYEGSVGKAIPWENYAVSAYYEDPREQLVVIQVKEV